MEKVRKTRNIESGAFGEGILEVKSSERDKKNEEEITELSPEAREVISLYKAVHETRSEEKQELAALEFLRKLYALVEQNPDDLAGEERWHYSSRGQARQMVYEDKKLYVGSGTAGCRIYLDSEHPKTYEAGEWMYYFKPEGDSWMYGGRYWENFMKHFKNEIVRLSEK